MGRRVNDPVASREVHVDTLARGDPDRFTNPSGARLGLPENTQAESASRRLAEPARDEEYGEYLEAR